MNTSKFEGHTPGPWAVSYDGEETLCWPDAIYNPETNAAIVVFEFGTGRVVEEANAVLIAAAPDLLERVKVLDDALTTIKDCQIQWGMIDDMSVATIKQIAHDALIEKKD